MDRYLALGYQRIKLKIKPGWDVDVVAAVRRRHPDILLSVDANSAYSLADLDRLRQLDESGLLMIEQPLDHDDLLDHAAVQAALHTPIWLDESINSARRAEQALRPPNQMGRKPRPPPSRRVLRMHSRAWVRTASS